MLVFVDTSAWIGVVARKDSFHPLAKDFYKRLLDEKALLVTSNYVLDETVTRIRYDIGHKQAVEFLQAVDAASSQSLLRVYWVSEEIAQAARELFEKYSDQMLSFTDCTSAVICHRLTIEKVFTFDKHFAMLGFQMVKVKEGFSDPPREF